MSCRADLGTREEGGVNSAILLVEQRRQKEGSAVVQQRTAFVYLLGQSLGGEHEREE